MDGIGLRKAQKLVEKAIETATADFQRPISGLAASEDDMVSSMLAESVAAGRL